MVCIHTSADAVTLSVVHWRIVLSGEKIPPAMVPIFALPAVLLFFFLLAVGEEVGWLGYAFETMQRRLGNLWAVLLLGIIWAVWHIPFFVLMMQDVVVLFAQVLILVGIRVFIVWIFSNTGKSLFAAILFHAIDNTALVTMPEIKSVIPWGSVIFCILVSITALIMSFLWGAKTLNSFRSGSE